MNNKVAIILINYNGLEDTLECIKSIELSNYKNYKVIVVDNNSKKDEGKIIKENCKQVKVINSKDNLGFSGGNNLGIKYAIDNHFDKILLLNNDTIIDSDMIENLLKYSNASTIVAPKMYYYSDKNVIWYGGGYISKLTGNAYHYQMNCEDQNDKDIKECTFATGCCMMIDSKIIQKYGYLSEEYFMYCEDTDYCLRLLKNNINIIYNPKAVLWHKISKSTGGKLSPFSAYYMTRNRLIYIKKFKNYFYPTAYIYTIITRYVRIIQFILAKNEIWKYIRKGISDANKNLVGKSDNFLKMERKE